MKHFLNTWIREYRRIFSDTGILLIFFGAILIYPFFYPLPYQKEVLKEVPVAVVDMDHSRLSHQLTRMISASELVEIKEKTAVFEMAKRSLMNGKIGGIVYIPADLEKMVLRGEQAVVSVYPDASYFLVYRQVMTGILRAAGTLSAGIEVKRMMAGGSMQEAAFSDRDPLPLVSMPLFNSTGGYATYVVPAVLILILQQTLLIGVGLLSGTRRERGENRQVPEQPGSVVSLLLGRACAYFSIYMVHAVYFFGILFRFYHFPQRGNPTDLALFIIPYLFASIFLAQAISGFFRNREISMIILLFSSIPALFLSGFSWPKSCIPDWLNRLALLLPSTSGIDGALRISIMGASLKSVTFDWAVLLVLTAVFFILAVVLTKRQFDGYKE